MATKLKLTLKGFDEMIEKIEAAGGKIKPAVDRALTSSANLLTQKIKEGANARNVPTDSLIRPAVKWSGNIASVEVGFALGAYTPGNLSSGYLALFKEYGTGKRATSKGYNRGALTADPFIRPALEDGQKEVRKAQQEALDRILKDLTK